MPRYKSRISYYTGLDASKIGTNDEVKAVKAAKLRIPEWISEPLSRLRRDNTREVIETGDRSSNVERIGYNRSEQVLQVIFKHGGIYLYYDISPKKWKEFKRASSKGKFVWKELRRKPVRFDKLKD